MCGPGGCSCGGACGCGGSCGNAILTRPTTLEGITDLFSWAGDFALGFTGQRPVYANGAKIGYWSGDPRTGLCTGQITVENTAQAQATGWDPSKWTTKDDLWRDVSVTSFCQNMGVQSPWVTTTGQPPATVSQPNTVLQDIEHGVSSVVSGVTSGAANIQPVLIGGLAIFALLMVLKK